MLSLCLPIVLAVHENEVAKAKRKLDEEREVALERGSESVSPAKALYRERQRADRSRQPLAGTTLVLRRIGTLPEGASPNPVYARLVTTMSGPRLSRLWSTAGPIISVRAAQPTTFGDSAAKAVTVVDLANPGSPLVLEHPQPLWQCAFSPDGKWLATSCNDAKVRLWPTSNLKSQPKVLQHDDLQKWMALIRRVACLPSRRTKARSGFLGRQLGDPAFTDPQSCEESQPSDFQRRRFCPGDGRRGRNGAALVRGDAQGTHTCSAAWRIGRSSFTRPGAAALPPVMTALSAPGREIPYGTIQLPTR